MVNRSAASASVLKEPSIELKNRIDEALTMLCAEHLLPYSFVEWPAMRMLMARLLESGGVAVSVLLLVSISSLSHSLQLHSISRRTLCRRLTSSYTTVRDVVANEIAKVVLTVGQGAFFLELDGATTVRGECKPILVAFGQSA